MYWLPDEEVEKVEVSWVFNGGPRVEEGLFNLFEFAFYFSVFKLGDCVLRANLCSCFMRVSNLWGYCISGVGCFLEEVLKLVRENKVVHII